MTKLVKTTGLAAFTRKDVVSATSDAHARVSDDGEIQKKVAAKGRKRGKGETVALTVRLPRAEWERVHQLAVSEGASIQSLAIEGLSLVFSRKGLPEIEIK